jgi:ribonuclease-3
MSESNISNSENLVCELKEITGVDVQDALLDTALTHPSFVFEHIDADLKSNQRLEFLGDAILGFIVGEYLYLKFPQKAEGELTKMRAAVVCEASLAKQARRLNLGQALYLGRGELLSGGRERTSILADALEALIGAIYLQFGLEKVRELILALLSEEINNLAKRGYGDAKTMLQERAQHENRVLVYRVLEETGPDHNKLFMTAVFVDGVQAGTGSGHTKKEAEQRAAEQALRQWSV